MPADCSASLVTNPFGVQDFNCILRCTVLVPEYRNFAWPPCGRRVLARSQLCTRAPPLQLPSAVTPRSCVPCRLPAARAFRYWRTAPRLGGYGPPIAVAPGHAWRSARASARAWRSHRVERLIVTRERSRSVFQNWLDEGDRTWPGAGAKTCCPVSSYAARKASFLLHLEAISRISNPLPRLIDSGPLP